MKGMTLYHHVTLHTIMMFPAVANRRRLSLIDNLHRRDLSRRECGLAYDSEPIKHDSLIQSRSVIVSRIHNDQECSGSDVRICDYAGSIEKIMTVIASLTLPQGGST